MPDRTPIQWTDATWNPIRGCSRVSEGCRHCYAEAVAARFSGPGQAYAGLARRRSNGEPQWTGEVRLIQEHLEDPLRWRRPRRIFVNSMSDLFHEKLTDDEIGCVFGTMAACHHFGRGHTFQVLTKRPRRMLQLLSADWFREYVTSTTEHLRNTRATKLESARAHETMCEDHYDGYTIVREPEIDWPLPNVWLGVSVENQDAANERIPLLLETPATVRFLSCEPLLGAVDLTRFMWGKPEPCAECPKNADCECGHQTRRWLGQPSLDWVIVGGESGPDARPFRVEWARSIIGQCRSAEVPVFVKQLGRWIQGEEREFPCIKVWLLDDANQKVAFSLFDSHGGATDEWPEDLRVREFPAEMEASAR